MAREAKPRVVTRAKKTYLDKMNDIIAEHAEATGAVIPIDTAYDHETGIRTILATKQTDPADEMGEIQRMKALGYEMKPSADGYFRTYTIKQEQFEANQRAHQALAIARTKPRETEVEGQFMNVFEEGGAGVPGPEAFLAGIPRGPDVGVPEGF